MAGAMRATLGRLGRLDCLVANAGTAGKQSFTDMTLGEWHRVLHVNLDGAFLCLREAARVLVGQGQGGSLVGVSSTSAIDGAPRPAALRGQQDRGARGDARSGRRAGPAQSWQSAGAAETSGHHGGDPGPGYAAGIAAAAPEIVAVPAAARQVRVGQADSSRERRRRRARLALAASR
jgi:NAD(P)-dependent dehydrogenase (short-subunit alcohol dehydrogenase family)